MEEKEKKSFWKDKKNVAIVILSILLFFSMMSTSGDTTPSGTAAELKAEVENTTVVNQINETEETKLKEYENQIEVLKTEKTALEEKVENLSAENDKLKKENDVSSSTTSSESSTKNVESTKTSSNSQSASTDTSSSYTVYITNTGSKYHRDGCSYLKSKTAIDKNDAIAQGYTPCSKCNP